ncbi:alanine racemase [Paenibacillus baekrokdamisoli]|uniref:Alanine racemase n=1 Tax=Paenibacillus baekrokdamisoli TaxID=1712516 RepID=A0A3G9J1I5_9BACL|nr:alanine racemase [Paenibacillus baekrokdamisoli]MBB3071336.1 alanine racemase [Paenibacillus baekrokdamisoli]BBH24626.1 alanine racemase [Paenibacillus baekrokdamisoli]
MNAYYRPTRVEISLDALRRNILSFRSVMPKGMRLMASVKANAYGHGAAQVAREAEASGVDYLGVAFLDEALQLRKAGIEIPILVLGYVPPEGLASARESDITIALFSEEIVMAAAALPAAEKPLRVHIKIDTGMGRLGLLAEQVEDALRFINRAMSEPGLEVEGMFTHYAQADETDKTYTQLQYERFAVLVQELKRRSIHIPIIHAANSAAGIDTPEWGGSMLRLGISMYGLYPSAEVNKQRIQLEPVLSLKTKVVMVKQAPPGWGISYGTRYVTKGEERIGTLPIGYADGYSRMLTGKAEAIVRGQRVPVLGTICMDQCMIALDPAAAADSVDSMNPVEAGEEVVLIGSQGKETITVEEIADKLGTINYELICMIATRVPRVYTRDGQVVVVHNPLD